MRAGTASSRRSNATIPQTGRVITRANPARARGAGKTVSVATDKEFQRVASSSSIQGQEYWLAVLDVDHYRALKNLHGQGASECLLRTLGKRLEYETTSRGGILMRLGVDEFAMLLPAGVYGSGAVDWATSLLLRATMPFTHRGTMFSFTASIGVTVLSGGARMAGEALRCARQALSQAKHSGGNVAMSCSARQLAEILQRGELARDLAAAIEAGQLVPFYQPVVAMQTGRVTGMEVLARWLHPTHGLLEPACFIGIAEEHGLCSALTRALLRRVRGDAATWPASWSFAFNTTPDELPSILEFIANQDRSQGGAIDIRRIELEVTETALMRDVELSRRAVIMMQPVGVKVVLDDFGSGYSNFKQLRQVPFSRLKIDKSFITDMLDDGRAAACARSIIDLAHHLGMTATAEGVECEAVAVRLAEMGCDHAQGYYYGRPIAASAVTAWLETGGGGLEFAA